VLTIASAMLVGLIVEADGLRVWADRLTVGALRDVAQPATRHWADLTRPLHLQVLRQWALQGKEELSAAMIALPHSNEVQPAAVAEQESLPVHAQPAVPLVASRNDEGSTERSRTEECLVRACDEISTYTAYRAGNAPSDQRERTIEKTPSAGLGPAIASTTAPVAQREAASAAPSSSSNKPDDVKLAMLVPPVRVSASVTLRLPPLGLTRKVRVALAGDSMMAVGLAPTLTRGLATEKNMHLVRAYRSGTGLARPEVLDWLVEYPRMLGADKPDIVICAIGANDAQNVQVGKQVLQFGSPQWNDFFRQRLTAYLDMLTRDHARVLWLAMPVMKAATFAQKMEQINAVARGTVAQYPGVTWLDVSAALGDAKDGFHQFRADERGRLIKLRADDGIHLSDDGAASLLLPIRDWLARAATASATADK